MKNESLSDRIKRAKARWLKRVMQHQYATSTQKCLAHAIADRLNCVTLDCWAAQPTLARDIGHKSVKTVVRAGRGLAKLNLITLKRIKARPGLRHTPILLPEDLDRPVPKGRHRRGKIADTNDGESFLSIQPESFSTEEAAEEAKRAASRGLSFNPRERGAIEVKLAEKFGADGFDVLARLASIDDAIIERLCQAYAEGGLSERDLAAARLAAEQV
jgi:hypothetical protein